LEEGPEMRFKQFLLENDSDINAFQEQLQKKYDLTHLRLYKKGNDLTLDMIVVPKDKRKQGIGSKVLEDITHYADVNGLRTLLTTAVKDTYHGTTSGTRLKEFYKKFGFVENKGRNKDFTTMHNMIREPKKNVLKESEEVDLTEASKELNIVSFLSDKISKTLDEIVRKPEQFKQYQPNNSGQFVIPFKKFIGDLNVPKNSFLKSLTYGKLFLDLGSTKDSTHPFLEIVSHKDGRNIRKKAGGYYTNEFDLEIHLPFIDKQTYLPFEGYSKHWKSLLVHELTHAIQDLKGEIKSGTAQLSNEEWFSNKSEQEAVIHQLYKVLQKHIKELFSEMKFHRTDDEKYRDVKKSVIESNVLYNWFKDFESFKKSFRMDQNLMYIDNPIEKDRLFYLWDNHKDVYNKFLADSYKELKKEFAKVIPEKILIYK
jgi:N-acetylglutamate synthase-like GNAT family acetyltransferase